MSKERDPVEMASPVDADHLGRVFKVADRVLIKKLSNNDRQWAHLKEDGSGKPKNKQNGVYIPHEQRDGGFFPALELMQRDRREADEIRECFLSTVWPQLGNAQRQSRLVHYSSKGQETHLTRLPKAAFAELLPASFLVVGRTRAQTTLTYQCLTIDSDSPEAAYLQDYLDLGPDFLIGEFEPASIIETEHARVLDFAAQVTKAWLAGEMDIFATKNTVMPSTKELANLALAAFLKKEALEKIDPFSLSSPGDALREISREIEWGLFREFQRREKSVELVRIVLGDSPRKVDASEVIIRMIEHFVAIDGLMLSASQQRKVRAGYSYEHHIEAMLVGGDIPFEKQVIIESKKRPDFVIPSMALVDGGSETAETGLILSAKTTLRERWKQVEREKKSRHLFLTTVDENVSGNAIEDMASFGVILVVPEKLIRAGETEYAGHKNVMTFREFCDEKIKPHLALWHLS